MARLTVNPGRQPLPGDARARGSLACLLHPLRSRQTAIVTLVSLSFPHSSRRRPLGNLADDACCYITLFCYRRCRAGNVGQGRPGWVTVRCRRQLYCISFFLLCLRWRCAMGRRLLGRNWMGEEDGVSSFRVPPRAGEGVFLLSALREVAIAGEPRVWEDLACEKSRS